MVPFSPTLKKNLPTLMRHQQLASTLYSQGIKTPMIHYILNKYFCSVFAGHHCIKKSRFMRTVQSDYLNIS